MKLQNIIYYLFAALLFFVPLILWPYTSEVFEFNKMVLTYGFGTLIVATWMARMVIERKFIFSRTILDIPILIFLATQLISTFFSIEPHTSLFGYYSRFNGGLISFITYSLLYWAFVSNIDKAHALKLIKVTFASATIVSIYGVLEHFGIDKDIWVQDVQSRVFSTLGQPNWLAAYVIALIPLAWAFALNSRLKSLNFFVYFSISILFFWTLIFTKSRSGLLGFGAASFIFYILTIWQNKKDIKKVLLPLFLFGLSVVIVSLISGTQWTPSLKQYFNKEIANTNKVDVGTSLETGGTESGTIRKIVWKGALDIWKHYPVFGTGVETFAFSYYLFRPLAHNLTSEWDFIYNKAHNEFLNHAANSGSVGLIAYLALIIFVVVQILRSRDEDTHIKFALTAGIVSLMVSNFFGFSVVPTQLQLFLFPALAIALAHDKKDSLEKVKLSGTQKTFMALIGICALYTLVLIINYWKADILYAKGKAQNMAGRPDIGAQNLLEAVKISPKEAVYYGELSASYSAIAMAYDQTMDATSAAQFSGLSISSIEKAINLAPANLNLRRQQFGIYVRLSTIDENMLIKARESVLETIKRAPTDPKLYYNLGIAEANLGQSDNAVNSFAKAIELKSNYADARIQYAALLVHLKRNVEAKAQLEYVLKNIDPNNTTAKTALENIN